jgi:transcription initiation factor IIE alpha subunit
MNLWKQTKLYTCPKCGASYVHDRAYAHQLFQCPKRDTAKR